MKNQERISTTADRLKEALSDRQIKPADLAKIAKVDKGSISHYLAGDYDPKQKTLNRLASALNVSLMWLWGYDVPKERTMNQKENDDLVRITVMLRRDSDFFETVNQLSTLPPEQYNNIRELVSALSKK